MMRRRNTNQPSPGTRSSSNTAYLPLVSVLCGATAGLLGIGGGMIIGPLLLELGLENQAVAATGVLGASRARSRLCIGCWLHKSLVRSFLPLRSAGGGAKVPTWLPSAASVQRSRERCTRCSPDPLR